MKPDGMDWQVLRAAFIALLGSLVLSALMLGASAYFEAKMRQEFVQHKADFQSVSRRYLALDKEARLIKRYYPAFQALREQGMLGQERRLDWLEALQAAAAQIRLPALEYQIAAQAAHTPAFAAKPGGYQLQASAMSLDMQLLHEGDLFALFDALDAHADGLYQVSRCSLTRNGAALAVAPAAANIHAQCELEWFTITLADGSELAR